MKKCETLDTTKYPHKRRISSPESMPSYKPSIIPFDDHGGSKITSNAINAQKTDLATESSRVYNPNFSQVTKRFRISDEPATNTNTHTNQRRNPNRAESKSMDNEEAALDGDLASHSPRSTAALDNYRPSNADGASEESGLQGLNDKDNWFKYTASYRKVVQADRSMTKTIQILNREHQNAVDRARKVANRRNERISRLEQENSTLRSRISNTETNTASLNSLQLKYDTSQRAVEMLTDDNRALEARIDALQRELDRETVRSATAERNTRIAREEIRGVTCQHETCKQRVAHTDRHINCEENEIKRLKQQLAQMEDLVMFYRDIVQRTDQNVLDRIRELARLSDQLANGGDERMKMKVWDQAASLINAWVKFETEWNQLFEQDESEH